MRGSDVGAMWESRSEWVWWTFVVLMLAYGLALIGLMVAGIVWLVRHA